MHGHRERNLRGIVVVAMVAAIALAGCSDGRDVTSLCSAYDSYVTARQEVRQLDPASMSAGEVATAADNYLEAIHGLQQAADGRYAAPLGVLEASVADVRRSTMSMPDDSDAKTWLPLVRDDLSTAARASASVTHQISATCPTS